MELNEERKMKYLILLLISTQSLAQESRARKFLHALGAGMQTMGQTMSQDTPQAAMTPFPQMRPSPQNQINCYSNQVGSMISTQCY